MDIFGLKMSTSVERSFFAHDVNGDAVVGKVTGDWTKLSRKQGGTTFGVLSVTVTEISNGWYRYTLAAGDVDTLGELDIIFTATGVKQVNLKYHVSARLADDLAYPATTGRSMVVDAAGLIDANTVKIGPTGSGVAQAARDIGTSVLLSAGTGTGQLDFTSGVVKANFWQLLGTLLTEGVAGRLKAAFTTFFDIATPTSTMNLITGVTTVTNLTNAPTTGDLTATMKSSVTAAVPTAAAIGTDAASKVLVTPAQKVVTDASGYVSANVKSQDNIDFGALQKVSLNAATPAVTVSDKTGFSLSTDGVLAIWHQLISGIVTASTIGKKLVDWALGSDNKVLLSSNTQTGVVIPTVTNLTNAPTTGDLTATMKSSINAEVDSAITDYDPPTRTEATSDKDAVIAEINANEAKIDTLDTVSDLIYSKVSNLSITSRLQVTTPLGGSIIRSASGDKYIQVEIFLTDADGNAFDSRDYDGGDWSDNSHFKLGDRVKPTTNNAGGYFFEMTTYNGTDAGGTAADWSTAQTPSQTCVSGNGDTYTNIGTTPGVTDKHNGFGIVVSDENGANWTLYSDAIGTPLHTVNECHHHGDGNEPQICNRISTGTYEFFMNVDDAETPRNINFYLAWFDKARWEVGYSTSYHRRQLYDMQILAVADLSAASIAAEILTTPANKLLTDVNGYVISQNMVTDVAGSVSDISGRIPAALVSGRMDVSVGAYQTGLTPADSVLATPASKLATDGSGHVTAENMVTDVSGSVSDIQSRIPAALVSGRMDSSVGGYQTGLVPADSVLATPANKLATDANGFVTEVSVDGIKKNTALANFEFLMVDSTDHVTAKTGLTVTATRSIDGGVFGACANNVAEVADGIYKINFADTDLNGNIITFKFTASGADTRFITIKTNT
jgi:hypothetical protein